MDVRFTEGAVDAILTLPESIRNAVRRVATSRAERYTKETYGSVGRNDIVDAVRCYYVARDIHKVSLVSEPKENVVVKYTLPDEALQILDGIYEPTRP